MKKYLVYFLCIALAGTTISCKNEKETVKNEPVKEESVTDYQTFTINKEQSNIDWKGYKIFKSESTSHFGTMAFSEGDINVKDGKLVSGKLVIDTKSITSTDIEDKELAAKLDNHLKNSDFFDVEQFPTATFEITKVTPSEHGDYNSIIEGNLTIKGITKAVSFNANVKVDTEQVSIYTEPTDIDRTEFGVKFQLPIKDGIIKNEFTLQVVIKAFNKK